MLDRIAIGFPQSADEIMECYFRYLQSLSALETELLPTRENACKFSMLYLVPAWERKEPILVARLEDKIIGATFTTLPDEYFHWRVPFATGHGTWVQESFRKLGVARLLIDEVRRMLREKGITRQVGMAHVDNQISLSAFARMGFVPFSTVLKYDLP